MAEAATSGKSGKVVITNIGLLLSGDIDNPILDADTIVVNDGLIVAVGKAKDCDLAHARTTIDAHQTCVAPGLIDSHVHPVFGDWTPRAFDNFRPGGVKVLAGAPVIEKGMVEQDFKDLAEAGVSLLGEVGLGSVKAGYEAKEMVAWARKYGIQSTIHTGGPSIPGSGLIDKDVVLEADADVIGHINGGHTALSEQHVCELCEKSSRAIEIVHNGNEKVAIAAAQAALQLKCPHRVILGTDGPAGSGVQPLGMLRLIALLSSLGNIPAELAFCFATGNTARIRKLNCGLIEVGRDADFVFMDRAQHTAGRDLLDSVQRGDIPGVGMVMIDGIVRCGRSRNTPPATTIPSVVEPA